MNRILPGLVVALWAVFVVAAPPELIRYQARLVDDAGVPLTGSHDLVFTIYDAASGGSQLWSEGPDSIEMQNGLLDRLLGQTVPLTSSVFTAPDRWMEISVDGVLLAPRQPLSSVPFAHAADRLDTLTVSEVLDRSSHTGTQAPDTISPQGDGSGLDADTLDGFNASQLLGGAEFVLTDAQSYPLSTDRADYALITAVLQSDGMNEVEQNATGSCNFPLGPCYRPVNDTFAWELAFEFPSGTPEGIKPYLDAVNVTEGMGSYRGVVGYGGNYPGVHALELFAPANLTDVNEIKFDMLVVSIIGGGSNAGVRFYIGGVLQRTYNTNGSYLNETFDTSSLSGIHQLKFRWEIKSNQVGRLTESSIDNLRLIGSAVIASSVAAGSATDLAIDGDTGTYFESDPEIKPWLQAEMSFEGEAEPAGVYVHPHPATTASALWIELSADELVWDRALTLTVGNDLTLGTDNFVRVNRPPISYRYFRVRAADDTETVLALSEVSFRDVTHKDWNRRHGHEFISAYEFDVP